MRTIGRRWPADKPFGEFVSVCDYCGVPWYRSQLRRDGAGLLACPDEGDGPSATEQLEANAEKAMRWAGEQAERAQPVYDGRPFVFEATEFESDPVTLLGDDCAAWLRAESAESGSWADETGNLTLAGAARALRSETGQAAVEIVGSVATLTGALASPLLAGTRPYIWIVGQFLGDENSASHTPTRSLFSIASSGNAVYLVFGYRMYSGIARTTFRSSPADASIAIWASSKFDREPHAFECSLADSNARLFVDEVQGDYLADAGATGALDADLLDVTIGDSFAATTAVRGRIRDLIISRSQPDTATLTAMRAYCSSRLGFTL